MRAIRGRAGRARGRGEAHRRPPSRDRTRLHPCARRTRAADCRCAGLCPHVSVPNGVDSARVPRRAGRRVCCLRLVAADPALAPIRGGSLRWRSTSCSGSLSEPPGAFAPVVFTAPQPGATINVALAPCDVPHHCGVRQLYRVPVYASADAKPPTIRAKLADRWSIAVHGDRQPPNRNGHEAFG